MVTLSLILLTCCIYSWFAKSGKTKVYRMVQALGDVYAVFNTDQQNSVRFDLSQLSDPKTMELPTASLL